LISEIEIITIRNSAATATVTEYAAGVGVTAVSSYLSTGDVTITNLAAGATVGYVGNENIVNGALSATYKTAATGAATLNISGGTTIAAGTTGNVALIGAGTTSTVINSTGSANKIGTVTNAATSKTLTINAAVGLETGNFATGVDTKLVITGAAATGVTQTAANNGVTAAVKLGALTAAVADIDASAMTAGGVSLALVAATTSFKGGQGADVVTTVALTSTSASIIDAGTGTDTLVLRDNADVATEAKAGQYKGFENLDTVTHAANMSLIKNSTITGVMMGASSAAITNMTAAQANNVTIYANATTPSFGITDASNVGQIDTLKLTFSDGLAAKGTITMGAFTATGVEVINVVATDNVTMSSLANVASMTSMTVTGGGNLSITTAAHAAVANASIDATAVTGTVTLNAFSATANGMALKGSLTKANTLTGTTNADSISGGAANDTLKGLGGDDIITTTGGVNTIHGGAGADKITVGSGKDIVVLRGDSSSITDVGGTAQINLTGALTARASDATTDTFTVSITINDIVVTSAAVANNSTATAQLDAVRAALLASEASQYVTAAGTTAISLTSKVDGVAFSASDVTFTTISTGAVGTLSAGTFATNGAGTVTTANVRGTGVTSVDTVTGFDFGTADSAGTVDRFMIEDGSATAITIYTGTDTAITAASLTAALNAAVTKLAQNEAGLFTFDGSTYLVIDRIANSTVFGETTAMDVAVKLVGHTGTIDTTDFFFA
jgi:hypothetical protein